MGKRSRRRARQRPTVPSPARPYGADRPRFADLQRWGI